MADATDIFPAVEPKFSATLHYGRISPRKLRRVADLIRGKDYTAATAILRHTPQRGAYFALKLLRSAFAGASQLIRDRRLEIDPEELHVSEIFVDGGATLKRWRASSLRRPTMIRKRTSHMTLVLAERQKAAERKREVAAPTLPPPSAPGSAPGTAPAAEAPKPAEAKDTKRQTKPTKRTKRTQGKKADTGRKTKRTQRKKKKE